MTADIIPHFAPGLRVRVLFFVSRIITGQSPRRRPLYIAQEKGFFAKYNIEPEMVIIEDESQYAAALASNRFRPWEMWWTVMLSIMPAGWMPNLSAPWISPTVVTGSLPQVKYNQ